MVVLCLVLVLLFITLSPSSCAAILMAKKERAGCIALIVFLMSCVLWLFLRVLWVGLQNVISLVFSDNTHLLFWCLLQML